MVSKVQGSDIVVVAEGHRFVFEKIHFVFVRGKHMNLAAFAGEDYVTRCVLGDCVVVWIIVKMFAWCFSNDDYFWCHLLQHLNWNPATVAAMMRRKKKCHLRELNVLLNQLHE